MKTILSIILLLPLFISCQNKIEKGNLDLEKVNFNTFSAKKFYAKALTAEFAEYHQKMRNGEDVSSFTQAKADSIDINGDNNETKPFAVTYSQTVKSKYIFGFFKGLKFTEVNAVTDLDDNLLIISGSNDSIDLNELDKIIANISKDYGKPIKSGVSRGMSDFNLDKWETDDKIVTLVYNGKVNFRNVILTEKEKEFIKNAEQKNSTSVTLFICKKDIYKTFQKMNTRIGFLTEFEKEE